MGKKINYTGMTREQRDQKADELERAAQSFADSARKLREMKIEEAPPQIEDYLHLRDAYLKGQCTWGTLAEKLGVCGWDGSDPAGRVRMPPANIMGIIHSAANSSDPRYIIEMPDRTTDMICHAYKRALLAQEEDSE